MKNAVYSPVDGKTTASPSEYQIRPNQAEIDDVKVQIGVRTNSSDMLTQEEHQTNVVAYLRVSTNEQSIEMQKSTIEMLCNQYGYDYEKVVFYQDEGVSAFQRAKRNMTDRKGGRSMMRAISFGRVKAVLCYRLDRLFRSDWVGLQWLEKMVDEKIEVWALDCRISIHETLGRKMAGYSLVDAQAESAGNSDRTTHGMDNNAKQGGRNSQSIWGWDWDAENELMVPNWLEKSVIDWMRDRKAEGWANAKIGRALKDIGLRGKRGGRSWNSGIVDSILTAKQHKYYADWDEKPVKSTYPFKYLRQVQKKKNPQWFGL